MAKSIRLLNVDYIVTSSDKIVDLNDIGSVLLHTFAADGHSKSASHLLTAGGNQGGNGSYVQTASFSDLSYKTSHTSLGSNYDGLSSGGGSNGSEMLQTGYHWASYSNSTFKLQFAAGASAQGWGDAGGNHSQRGHCANSDYAIAVGGQSPSTTAACHLKSFSTNANAAQRNSLTTANAHMTVASNGTLGISAGGGVYAKHTFDDTGTTAVSFGSTADNRKGMISCSNGAFMLLLGSSGPTAQCEQKHFDSSSSTSFHSSLSLIAAAGGVCCGSSGTEAMHCRPDTSKTQFDTLAAFSSWGSLSNSVNGAASGSGNL